MRYFLGLLIGLAAIAMLSIPGAKANIMIIMSAIALGGTGALLLYPIAKAAFEPSPKQGEEDSKE